MKKAEHIIDAKGMKLGRVASEAAKLLMGKNLVSFERRLAPVVEVKIVNASKMSISEQKRAVKKYPYFSGYQGGLRFVKLEALIEKKGYKAALDHAIKGMLPKNKLRPDMMKHVHITD